MKQDSYVTSSPASPPTVCASQDSAPSQSRGEGVVPPALPGQHIIIDYTNWRGERSIRRIVPNMESLWYGFNDWHKEAQWLLDAYDVEKGDIRTFAMKDIHSWAPATASCDEQPQAENPKGLSPQGASAAASAETPHPSPVDYTEVVGAIEALLALDKAGALVPHGIGGLARDLLAKSAQVIEAQAAENERKRQIIDTWHTSFLVAEERRQAAEARIAELEKERDALKDVEKAARDLPRSVPGSGGVSTLHTFTIEAAKVWANDEALRKLSRIRGLSTGGDSHG